ncbi:hypothetical protein MTBBW1_300071 [Desulfamplus magnetovallimortis]|uniref:RDD domain-containing protein n=1 Tax=Desulfamplus magnetovallimortis TaxID=1246637 RepID=A0A1W1HFT2_9BACT|nr:RDD family protein [Desulfamplus magnetovallimortis]SLM31340.1 hypothetical protein MTBBW1_300071 [Desulfamplus magnetovallimortis]
MVTDNLYGNGNQKSRETFDLDLDESAIRNRHDPQAGNPQPMQEKTANPQKGNPQADKMVCPVCRFEQLDSDVCINCAYIVKTRSVDRSAKMDGNSADMFQKKQQINVAQNRQSSNAHNNDNLNSRLQTGNSARDSSGKNYRNVTFEEIHTTDAWDNAPLASKGDRFLNYCLDIVACIAISVLFIVMFQINEAGFFYLIFFFYYLILEFFWGRTFGKLITKTKAVTVDGENLSFGKALGRSLCRFIPFEIFSFFSGSGGWHDRIPGTKVIRLS